MTIRRFFGLFYEAWRATTSAKLRTILSAVCIGIGITGIVLVLSLGEASINVIDEIMQDFGDDTVIVLSGNRNKSAGRPRFLTINDLNTLRERFPDAYHVATVRWRWGENVAYENAKFATQIRGVDTSTSLDSNAKIMAGRDLTPEDSIFGSNVCVIGSYTAEKLFKDGDAIGKQIKLGKFIFQVVGVTKPLLPGIADEDENNIVYIPGAVFARKYSWQISWLNGILLRFTDTKNLETKQKDVEKFMREHRNIREGEDDDFMVFSSNMVSKILFTALAAVLGFLSVITAVVLTVGGFVTANIFMLTTQTRIREIGIRRAFGATKQDIFTQFLFEFIIVSFIGMLIAVVIGTAVAGFISSFGVMSVSITLGVFVLTEFFALLVALIFGGLPAKNASDINPIEAIRSL